MKINSVCVLSYLKGKQIGQGGYYGADLSDLAKVMKVTSKNILHGFHSIFFKLSQSLQIPSILCCGK